MFLFRSTFRVRPSGRVFRLSFHKDKLAAAFIKEGSGACPGVWARAVAVCTDTTGPHPLYGGIMERAPALLGLFSGGTPAIRRASDGRRRGQGPRPAPLGLYKRRRRGRAWPDSCRSLSPTPTTARLPLRERDRRKNENIFTFFYT